MSSNVWSVSNEIWCQNRKKEKCGTWGHVMIFNNEQEPVEPQFTPWQPLPPQRENDNLWIFIQQVGKSFLLHVGSINNTTNMMVESIPLSEALKPIQKVKGIIWDATCYPTTSLLKCFTSAQLKCENLHWSASLDKTTPGTFNKMLKSLNGLLKVKLEINGSECTWITDATIAAAAGAHSLHIRTKNSELLRSLTCPLKQVLRMPVPFVEFNNCAIYAMETRIAIQNFLTQEKRQPKSIIMLRSCSITLTHFIEKVLAHKDFPAEIKGKTEFQEDGVEFHLSKNNQITIKLFKNPEEELDYVKQIYPAIPMRFMM
jgi:hypothetical protein